MKKGLILLFLSFVIIWMWEHKINSIPSQSVYLNESIISDIIQPPAPFPKSEIERLVEEINQGHRLIRNIVYEDITIRIKGVPLKISSYIAYEKNDYFRMFNSSWTGKEGDIGMNSTHFWFWSKRMKPSALYYAKHEDLYKSRLKSPFHPKWTVACLGINEIDLSNAIAGKMDKYYAIAFNEIDTLNRPIVRIILVDPLKKAIIGHYLYDENNNVIVSTEVLEFHNVDGNLLPAIMRTIWYQEDITMEWELEEPKINQTIPSNTFDMPNMRHKIDLGQQRPPPQRRIDPTFPQWVTDDPKPSEQQPFSFFQHLVFFCSSQIHLKH